MARTSSSTRWRSGTAHWAWALGALGVTGVSVGVLMGTGHLRAQAGYEREVESVDRPSDEPFTGELAAPVAAAEPGRVEASTDDPDDPLANHDRELAAEPCILEGVLRMPRNFPRTSEVTLLAWHSGEGLPPVTTVSPSDRPFRFDEVPPGEWTIVARAESGDRIAWGKSLPVHAVAGGHVSGISVALFEYYVEGVVTDKNGLPLAGLEFSLSWSPSDPLAGTRSPDHISFESYADGFRGSPIRPQGLTNLPSLSGEVSGFQAISDATLEADLREIEALLSAVRQTERVSHVEFEDPASPFAPEVPVDQPSAPASPTVVYLDAQQTLNNSLSTLQLSNDIGLVLTQGNLEVSGAKITFDDALVTYSSYRPASWRVPGGGDRRFTTGPGGTFRVALEGPGTFEIVGPEHNSDDMLDWLRTSVSGEVTVEAPIARADIELRLGGRVEGRVVRSDGHAAGIDVFLRRLGSGSTSNHDTDENGRFEYEKLEPGKYLFYARHGGSAGQDYCLHLELDVREGQTVFIDDILTASSSLTGVVQDTTGMPLKGVTVTASGSNNDNLTRRGKTDEFGVFTIVGMYACRYDLSVGKRRPTEAVSVDVPPQGALTDVGVVVVR